MTASACSQKVVLVECRLIRLFILTAFTLLLCIQASAQVGKKGEVKTDSSSDTTKTTTPPKRTTPTRSTSSANRNRGSSSTSSSTNTEGVATGSNSTLVQMLTSIKKSFESERPIPFTDGPGVTKNDSFEFDDCLIRVRTSTKGAEGGDSAETDIFDLTDIDPTKITVEQSGEFERKSFDVGIKTINYDQKIRTTTKDSSGAEKEDKGASEFLSFKDRANADRVAKLLEQAINVCKSK